MPDQAIDDPAKLIASRGLVLQIKHDKKIAAFFSFENDGFLGHFLILNGSGDMESSRRIALNLNALRRIDHLPVIAAMRRPSDNFGQGILLPGIETTHFNGTRFERGDALIFDDEMLAIMNARWEIGS